MRRILVLLLLIVSLGWSFNIQEYLSPNESAKSVAYLDMVGPDGAYVMYYVNNEPIMLVQGEQIVENKEIMVAVLERYFFNKDFPKASELKEIRDKWLEFNKSRSYTFNNEYIKEFYPPEKYCKQLTGLTVRHCNKNETYFHPCMMSCGAVPICKGSILEGGITSLQKTTKDFLDGILSLDEETMKLDMYGEQISTITTRLENAKYSDYNAQMKKDIDTLVLAMEGIEASATKIENNILFSDLLPAAGLQPYCGPTNYSDEAQAWLTSKAKSIKSRTINLFNVDAIATKILEKTAQRKELKAKMKTTTEYNSKFSKIDNTYNELYAKYVKVSRYVKDDDLARDIETLRAKKDSVRDDIYVGNYNKADLTIKQFDILAGTFRAKVDDYFNRTSRIDEYKVLADKKFIMAEWDIEASNIFLGQQLQDVKVKRAALDERLAAKIKPEELDAAAEEYGQIVSEVDEIIKAKKEHALDTALDKVVAASNSYSDALASLYAGTGEGSYQQKKQVREYVLPATLIMVDLVAIGAFIAAFVYMVGSGRIRLRKIAAVLWSFIFIAFFMAVAGGSIASYMLIDQKTNKASFDSFYTYLESENTTAIIIDARSGSISESCALSLKKTLESQMNKTVYLYRYELDGCKLVNYSANATAPANAKEKISVDACEEMMGQTPRIFLKSAQEDSTTFAVKYYPSATVSGSADYMQMCLLNTILEEGR
ncbi:MAG: hypothetical protein N3G76_01430 [Candidatus Micrarchaeota archaeon]|nr:hypothetical protein [Candidatus Micrarchaeota archaeon]